MEKMMADSIKTRIKLNILRAFDWMSDEKMIKIQYRLKTGRKLNLKNPIRYTEKLQWYKLYYKNPLMAKCADKWEVREYIKNKGYEHILNKCYGVYDNPDDIDFDKLPDSFVVKITNGASGIGIEICHDKNKIDLEELRNKLKQWLKKKSSKGGREWVYSKYPPRIIIEDIILPGRGEETLVDYKFFCFNGEPYCLYVMNERFTNTGVRQNIMDLDFNIMPYMREKIEPIRTKLKKPNNFEEMIKIATDLSKDFPYVRVDLYNHDGKIYFGELTFFPESGYYDFEPDEFDFILGEKFVLPQKMQ